MTNHDLAGCCAMGLCGPDALLAVRAEKRRRAQEDDDEDCRTEEESLYSEPDYGGAFDGFTVTSDADPGL